MSSNAAIDSATIRPLDPNRKDQVAEAVFILNEAYRSEKNWTSDYGFVRGPRTDFDEYVEQMKQKTVLVAVLEEAGNGGGEKVIGCISIMLSSESPTTGHLGTFAVRPDHGGKGLGTRLMKTAEEFCRGKGASHVVLDSNDRTLAIRAWYSRLGYVDTEMKRSVHEVIRGSLAEAVVDFNFIRMRKEL